VNEHYRRPGTTARKNFFAGKRIHPVDKRKAAGRDFLLKDVIFSQLVVAAFGKPVKRKLSF